ncbi:molybdopterin-dependent oxidoreductase [Adlercreutzia equolifaciens]|uniref:molybdopterin-containing oxidoreductase family protein n=1 Tax=Adlercreutzia equolifaciens TaxID=446660 RepID=UPI0023B1E4F0|nr:molybdopterin-dependent oxidoreductase [Adlercreutzia equolifaciens]MDE8702423.1 molybdopterin-dependent oxidoreductase [Adlercreutzia equolifaciens]
MAELTMTRRTFAKASALAGVAAAVGATMTEGLADAPAAFADAPAEVKTYKSMCHGCIQPCAVLVTVEDGVVTRIQGDPDAPNNKTGVCVKCLNQLHTCYSPRRVLHPMKHVERGTNNWETISWDEAIELAADKIGEAIEKYGPYSFFASGGGGGLYCGFHGYNFPEGFGSPNTFEPGGAQCFEPRVTCAPLVGMVCSQSIADSRVVEPFNTYDPQCEMLVIWGAQPTISQTANSGHAMADLRVDRGCKTVVVDPNFSPDAAKADVWLPVRPGTDTALLLSWIRYIFDNELYDEQFCKYWTNLPFLINPDTRFPYLAEEIWPDYKNPSADPNEVYSNPAYVCFDAKTNSIQPFPYTAPADSPVDPVILAEVEVNGKKAKTAGQIYWEEAEPWTLEAAGEYCWCKPEKIEEAIRLYTDAKVAGIAHGVATDQQRCASEAPLGCLMLDTMMGYIYKPGCTITLTNQHYESRPIAYWGPMMRDLWVNQYGISWVTGYTEKWNRERVENFEDKESQAWYMQMMKDKLGFNRFRGFYNQDTTHAPSILHAIMTGEPYKPRVWYDFSGNKFAVCGNASSWYDALGELDFIIGQHPIVTSFHYEACDLFFPMKEWLEWNGTGSQQNKTFMYTEVVHLGETAHNFISSNRVLQRYREKYKPEDLDNPAPLNRGDFKAGDELTEQTLRNHVAEKFEAESWEYLKEHQDEFIPKVIPEEQYYCYNQHEEIVDDGLPAGFPTESRKLEPYCTMYLHMSRTGFPIAYPAQWEQLETDYNPICVNIPPVEDPTTDTEYPLVITSGRLPYFHHGTMRHAAFARELCPVPDCKINPKTAAEYGIEHMDWIKITSRRGSTHARAYLTEAEAPGQLWMERFWNPEAYDASQKNPDGGWRQCNINVLTTNFVENLDLSEEDFVEGDPEKTKNPWNLVYGSFTLRGFTVKIEKSERPENIWVEPKEFQPFMPTLQSEPQTGDVY